MERSKEYSLDEAFLKTLTDAVFTNLNNEQFGAEEMAKEVGISRSQIHRKLQKINGKSVTQFIREIRLEEALRLLQKEVGTASEIAYNVGFGSPTYFNKCFHEYFGYPPGEVKKKKGTSPEFLKSSEEYDHTFEQNVDELAPSSTSGQESGEQTTFLKNKLSYLLIAGLIIILGAVLIWYISKERPSQEIDKSIAVLPFKNIGGSEKNQLLCDGMLEETLNKLQYISDLNVINRTSVEQYKTHAIDIKEIAKVLEVDNILVGSIRMYGNRFRINVQLIKAKTGFNLWSDEFDGVLSDTIFIVQSSIAQEIAIKLQATITPLERQQIEKGPTTNYMAYEKFMLGYQFLSEYWRIFDDEDIVMAEKLFRESLEIDPEFAMGYSGLADIYGLQNNYDSVIYYADKIIEYDPNKCMGYIWKGYSYWHEKDFDKALESYKKALELDPNSGTNYRSIGRLYCEAMQDYLTGIPYLKKAIELDLKTKSKQGVASNHARLGQAYLDIGDYEKAKQHYKTALEIYPMCFIIHEYCWLLGIETPPELVLKTADSLLCNIATCKQFCNDIKFFALYMSGKFSQAEAHFIEYEAKFEIGIPNTADSIWIVPIYKALGKEQQVLTILNSCRSSLQKKLKERESWLRYLSLSLVHAMLDEKDKALEYLSNAVDLGLKRGWHDFIEIYTPFENLWDDPKFKALVKRAQDEKAAIRAQVREM